MNLQSYKYAADALCAMNHLRAEEIAHTLMAAIEDDARSDADHEWHGFVPTPTDLRLLADALERHALRMVS